MLIACTGQVSQTNLNKVFNLFWYAVVCLVSVVIGGSVKFVTMTYFSRGDLVKALNNNGWSPSDGDYSERIEQLILSHFDLLREELVDEKKFKAFYYFSNIKYTSKFRLSYQWRKNYTF